MESFDEQAESLIQRIASAAARRLKATPPDPRQKAAASSSSLAELMAAGKDRAEDPHPALAVGRSLAALTLERQGNPLLLVPPPALDERMAASIHRAAVPQPEFATGRAVAEQRLAAREQLKALKNQNRELQSELQQVRSIKLRRESEHKRITESISSATTTNEKLKMAIMDLCNKRDTYPGLSDQQHQDLEIQEAKANEDATKLREFEAHFSWYHKFLGLQVVIGKEGLKFVFDKIHLQFPEKEYSLCLKIDDGTYNLVQCDPPIEGIEELVKDLNLSDDVLKFLKVARGRFQTSSINGNLTLSSVSSPHVHSVPPPSTTTVNRTSEDVPSQSNSQRKNKRLPAKRRGLSLSPGSVRHSPRFQVSRQQEK